MGLPLDFFSFRCLGFSYLLSSFDLRQLYRVKKPSSLPALVSIFIYEKTLNFYSFLLKNRSSFRSVEFLYSLFGIKKLTPTFMYMIYLASFEVLGRVNALLLKPGWLHTQYSRFNNCGYEIFTAVTNPISSEEEKERKKFSKQRCDTNTHGVWSTLDVIKYLISNVYLKIQF